MYPFEASSDEYHGDGAPAHQTFSSGPNPLEPDTEPTSSRRSCHVARPAGHAGYSGGVTKNTQSSPRPVVSTRSSPPNPAQGAVYEQLSKDNDTVKRALQKLCLTIVSLERRLEQQAALGDEQALKIEELEKRERDKTGWFEESIDLLVARMQDQQTQLDLQTGLIARIMGTSSEPQIATLARNKSLQPVEPQMATSASSRRHTHASSDYGPETASRVATTTSASNIHRRNLDLPPHPEHTGPSLADSKYANAAEHMYPNQKRNTNPWAHWS